MIFFAIDLDFCPGFKKGKLRIPTFVNENKKFLIAFIRGLFDTDGGFHRHNPYSAKVEITNCDPVFREEVKRALQSLGFNPFITKIQIYINSKSEVDKFFNLIKPNNPKHLYKYDQYKLVGQVPRHKDIEYEKLDYFKTRL